MPFKGTCPVQERIAIFLDYDTGVFSVSQLVARHGVSRETFYVWLRRRQSGDERWFEEPSRPPSSRPHTTSVAITEAKAWLTGALEAGRDLAIGSGHGPVDHLHRRG